MSDGTSEIRVLYTGMLAEKRRLKVHDGETPALFGNAGPRLQHLLIQPLFNLSGLPITFFFFLKTAVFLVVLTLAAHLTMLLLQKRVLTLMPLAIGQQYAVARMISYLVFVLGLIVGLQSLGLNLSSLVVVGGALGIGLDWACRPSSAILSLD